MLIRLLITALLVLISLGSQPLDAASSGLVQRDHLQAELVADVDSVQPGTDLRVGLRLVPDPGWHTYWKNPGDSGLATTIEWALPAGVSAAEIAWPYPDAIPFAHLINYGYDGEHLLPVTLSIPADLPTDRPLRLEARADWLVCEEICIPGDATLVLELPVSGQTPIADPKVAELFAWADARRPEVVDWPARFSTEGGQLSVQLESEAIGSARGWQFFSEDNNLVDHSSPPALNAGNGQLLVAQALSPFVNRFPESLDFVLVDRADLAGILGDLASVASETASNIDEGKTGPGRVLALSRWVMMIAEAWRSYSGKAFTFNATNSGEPLSPAAVFASTLAAKLPSPPRQSRVNNEMKKHIKKHRAFHRKNSDQSQE